MKSSEAKNLIGCCGLYCGLCSKFQSKAPSRCMGCRLGPQHAWCSIWNCCVKRHKFSVCSECDDLINCAIFLRRKVIEWIPAPENLRQIKERGIENWLENQIERQVLLEELLQEYNEGRSMSFYCKVCARMPIEIVNGAKKEAKEKLAREKKEMSDIKYKAKILKTIVKDTAIRAGINLD